MGISHNLEVAVQNGKKHSMWSRTEDGSVPVSWWQEGGRYHYEVRSPDGVQEFGSTRSFLRWLRGGGVGHWTHDRYFRLGRWSEGSAGGVNVLALFDGRPETGVRVSGGRMVGVDLTKKAKDVRRLLYAGFGTLMSARGYDPEDVLQEVYKGLLSRNSMKSAWDPQKAPFGFYVHMVCRSILYNYNRKMQKGADLLVDLASGGEDGDGRALESLGGVVQPEPERDAHGALTAFLGDKELVKLMDLQIAGYGQRDVCQQMGLSRAGYWALRERLEGRVRVWQEAGCP